MKQLAGRGLTASAVALALGLSVVGGAQAQQGRGEPPPGLLAGQVVRCVNGTGRPAANVAVGVDGGAMTGRTDQDGMFFIAVPPGQWTVVASADDGTASRPYVPITGGEMLDVGVLEIGGGVAGCAPNSSIVLPALPTFTPEPTATAVPPTPVPPTATPIPTPVPAEVIPPADPGQEPAPEPTESA